MRSGGAHSDRGKKLRQNYKQPKTLPALTISAEQQTLSSACFNGLSHGAKLEQGVNFLANMYMGHPEMVSVEFIFEVWWVMDRDYVDCDYAGIRRVMSNLYKFPTREELMNVALAMTPDRTTQWRIPSTWAISPPVRASAEWQKTTIDPPPCANFFGCGSSFPGNTSRGIPLWIPRELGCAAGEFHGKCPGCASKFP